MDNTFLKDITKEAILKKGVTVDWLKQEIWGNQDIWLFPELPDETQIFSARDNLTERLEIFINSNKAQLEKPGRYLGIWLNPKTDHWYLDITMGIKDKREAIEKVKQINTQSTRKIESLFNPFSGQTIYLHV